MSSNDPGSASVQRLFRPAALPVALCCLSAVLINPGPVIGFEAKPEYPQWGPELQVPTNTANTVKSKNLARVVAFLEARKYRGWPHDPYIRPTGEMFRTIAGDTVDGTNT